jgi:hypothetical protein
VGQAGGSYFLEWWDGKRRRRERAGLTPNEALEAQRRKQHELVGELIAGGKTPPPQPENGTATPRAEWCARQWRSRLAAPDLRHGTLRRIDSRRSRTLIELAKQRFRALD